MNNYERIKNNNIEQMADLLFAFTFYEEEEIGEDNTKILNWLKAEIEE